MRWPKPDEPCRIYNSSVEQVGMGTPQAIIDKPDAAIVQALTTAGIKPEWGSRQCLSTP